MKVMEEHFSEMWEGMSETRQKEFADTIFKNNKIEELRICYSYFNSNILLSTMKESMCNFHVDLLNNPLHPEVMVLSTIKWIEKGICGYCVALICYSRKSCGDFMHCSEVSYGKCI